MIAIMTSIALFLNNQDDSYNILATLAIFTLGFLRILSQFK